MNMARSGTGRERDQDASRRVTISTHALFRPCYRKAFNVQYCNDLSRGVFSVWIVFIGQDNRTTITGSVNHLVRRLLTTWCQPTPDSDEGAGHRLLGRFQAISSNILTLTLAGDRRTLSSVRIRHVHDEIYPSKLGDPSSSSTSALLPPLVCSSSVTALGICREKRV